MNYKKQVIIEAPEEDDFISPPHNNYLLSQDQYQYLYDDKIAGQGELQPRKSTLDGKQSSSSSKKPNQEDNISQAFRSIGDDSSATQKQKLLCLIHKQEISLICSTSQWHCEPLCIDCIPEHTQQHNKNRTQANIRKFDEVKVECLEKCQILFDQLNDFKINVQQLIEQPYIDDNLIHLKQWKQQIVQLFENYFDQAIKEYQDKINIIKQDENDHYEQIIQDITQYSNQLQTNYSEIQNFSINAINNIVKINQEKDILNIQNLIDGVHKKYNEEYRLNSVLYKYIQDNMGRLILIESIQNIKQQQQSQQKKQYQSQQSDYSSVKIKSTKCPNCNQQMNYVSDFKKHLECNNCSKIKRPNQLKK